MRLRIILQMEAPFEWVLTGWFAWGAGWLDHLRSRPSVPSGGRAYGRGSSGTASHMTRAWSPRAPNEHKFLDHDQMPLNQGPEISRTIIT
jgi:hypothetical protein